MKIFDFFHFKNLRRIKFYSKKFSQTYIFLEYINIYLKKKDVNGNLFYDFLFMTKVKIMMIFFLRKIK